jgi:hypothetical protein
MVPEFLKTTDSPLFALRGSLRSLLALTESQLFALRGSLRSLLTLTESRLFALRGSLRSLLTLTESLKNSTEHLSVINAPRVRLTRGFCRG